MFRTMKVSSYKIKLKVMENLMRYAGEITLIGLEKYIEMAIKQKQRYDKECYERNVIGIKKPEKLRFADYNQRDTSKQEMILDLRASGYTDEDIELKLIEKGFN